MADYNQLKVTELKDELKKRGIPSTGLTRKQQIVEALEAHDANDTNGTDDNDGAVKEPAIAPTGEGEDGSVEESETKPMIDSTDEPAQNQQDDDVIHDDTHAELPSGDPKELATPLDEDKQLASGEDTHVTVLEADAPVANDAVPEIEAQQSPRETSPDSRKRKRRSPTPPIREESINKKLKAVEGEVELEQNDDAVVDAPSDEVKPSEDAMDVADTHDTGESTNNDDVMDTEPAVAPSQHRATSVLYIRNLMRPLQPSALEDHLATLSATSGAASDASVIRETHLDALRTHAFVIFDSIAAASRARVGLHNQVWPQESQRKPLWVDFVPEETVRDWIAEEVNAGKDRRFEVVYSTSSSGTTEANLKEVASSSATGRQPSSTPQIPGPGMPNAPSGPRADQPSQPNAASARDHSPEPMDVERSPVPKQATSSSFAKLSERFSSTTSKPVLYHQPVSPTLVKRRLDELERETSRDWRGGRGGPTGTSLDQLKRYTFEDGDVVVDGGPDFGGFGRKQGAGGGGRPPTGPPMNRGRWRR